MIRTYLFTRQGAREDVPLDDWRSLVREECSLLWVDVESTDEGEMSLLADRFGLHVLALESCMDSYRRPHIYEFDDHFYVNFTVLNSRKRVTSGLKPLEMHLFAGEKFIITCCDGEKSEAVHQTLDEFKTTPGLCTRGPMYAVYLLAEDLVETYFPVVEKLDDEADKMETALLEKANKEALRRLFALKRRCFEIRKLLGPQRDVLSELARRDFPFVEGEDRVYFQDVYNRMIRIFDMLDTIREILSGNLDIYLSTVSNRLNEVMKMLTVAATILMTLSFITGFYGMNFTHLPWLDSPNAFRNLMIGMGGMTFGMLWWFRRKGWL